MASPTSVNSQITDAVSQANVKVLGDAPAMALGTTYQNLAQAGSLAAGNAVSAQQNGQALASSIVAAAVDSLLGNRSARR